MDRLMQALGLPGKSFVPLIVGFGCNVPSVMGARTLDVTSRERLMTIMMAPFVILWRAHGDFRRLCRRLLRAKQRALATSRCTCWVLSWR